MGLHEGLSVLPAIVAWSGNKRTRGMHREFLKDRRNLCPALITDKVRDERYFDGFTLVCFVTDV